MSKVVSEAILADREYLPKNKVGYEIGDSLYTVIYYPLEQLFEIKETES